MASVLFALAETQEVIAESASEKLKSFTAELEEENNEDQVG